MDRNLLKTTFYHLLAFIIYTSFSFDAGIVGGIMQLCFIVIHSVICLYYALNDDSKSPKAHWVSFFLILLIGFGVCTKLPLPVG
jgi:hypothetical protein